MPSRFLSDQNGSTAVEYAAIASFVSIVILVGAKGIGLNLSNYHFGALLSAMGW